MVYIACMNEPGYRALLYNTELSVTGNSIFTNSTLTLLILPHPHESENGGVSPVWCLSKKKVLLLVIKNYLMLDEQNTRGVW